MPQRKSSETIKKFRHAIFAVIISLNTLLGACGDWDVDKPLFPQTDSYGMRPEQYSTFDKELMIGNYPGSKVVREALMNNQWVSVSLSWRVIYGETLNPYVSENPYSGCLVEITPYENNPPVPKNKKISYLLYSTLDPQRNAPTAKKLTDYGDGKDFIMKLSDTGGYCSLSFYSSSTNEGGYEKDDENNLALPVFKPSK